MTLLMELSIDPIYAWTDDTVEIQIVTPSFETLTFRMKALVMAIISRVYLFGDGSRYFLTLDCSEGELYAPVSLVRATSGFDKNYHYGKDATVSKM